MLFNLFAIVKDDLASMGLNYGLLDRHTLFQALFGRYWREVDLGRETCLNGFITSRAQAIQSITICHGRSMHSQYS
jgi:hypothetical protein